MTKKALEFKLEYSEKETITAYAGLGLYGELYKSSGVYGDVKKKFWEPGSGNGYEANSYIYPLVMTVIGGGGHIEDIRKVACDKGLREVGRIEEVPSSDALGDWLKRESREKVEVLYGINDNLNEKLIKRAEKDLTLDIDAFKIYGEKGSAQINYEGDKGYMPMAGFIPEVGCCIGYEFREGNVSPGTRNYEFTSELYEKVKGYGKRIKDFRSDSAAYNSAVLNFVNREGSRYTITVDQDSAVREAISNIAQKDWRRFTGEAGFEGCEREYGEFVHSMNKTDHSFRVVVQRWVNPQKDLFKDSSEYCYHGVATNYLEEEKNSVEIIKWHNGRSNSENYNKELKMGFNLDHVPCGDFGGNGVWFGIVILAYNIFIASKIFLFPKSWIRKTIRTIRWEFICMAGKVLQRSRQLILRICSTLRETFEIYVEARQKCCELSG